MKVKEKYMADKNQEEEWSQLRETILLINVAVARIEHAMIDGNESVATLSQSFVDMVSSAQQITVDVEDLEDSPAKSTIEKNCLEISQGIQSSVVAFQFYDRLSQRMTLVARTLDSLNELLKNHEKSSEQNAWVELQKTIRAKYTLDSDQEMFDAVLNGIPIEEAMKVAVEKTTEDDIEFF